MKRAERSRSPCGSTIGLLHTTLMADTLKNVPQERRVIFSISLSFIAAISQKKRHFADASLRKVLKITSLRSQLEQTKLNKIVDIWFTCPSTNLGI